MSMPRINRPGRPPIEDRRVTVTLTDEEIEMIAEKAAQKAVARMTNDLYREVGRGVVNKFFWIVGLSTIGVYVYLQQKGYIR